MVRPPLLWVGELLPAREGLFDLIEAPLHLAVVRLDLEGLLERGDRPLLVAAGLGDRLGDEGVDRLGKELQVEIRERNRQLGARGAQAARGGEERLFAEVIRAAAVVLGAQLT